MGACDRHCDDIRHYRVLDRIRDYYEIPDVKENLLLIRLERKKISRKYGRNKSE